MKKTHCSALIAAFLISSCMVGFGRRGNIVVAPALPSVIEIYPDEYYYNNGYYYSYRDDIWFYSASRGGPWFRLPRDRYPREFHFRRHDHDEHWEPEEHHRR